MLTATTMHNFSDLTKWRSVGTGGGGGRYSHSDASSTNTYPGRGRGMEGSPTARTYPSTPRRQARQAPCNDNHGIRPPTPEQYLTPLQQKEVCIRHLRARLRDHVDRLQHRDCEIDELKTQLCRMQEDWIEEECHRVEAQLALKEARKEIQHLQDVVESVRTNLSSREPPEPHDHKPYPGLQRPAQPGGRSRSCGCSPANTLSRGATYTRLSSEALALQVERNSNPPDLSGATQPAGQTHLVLEAALLSEQLPPTAAAAHGRGPPGAIPHSPTFQKLCSGGAVLPISHSCHTLSGGCRCTGHGYLPHHHHHLFLHLPQDEPPGAAAESTHPPSPPPPAPPEKKPEVRSQASSPTMTWLSDERGHEELSVISLSADVSHSEAQAFPPSLPLSSPSDLSYSVGPKSAVAVQPVEMTRAPTVPQTFQPQPIVQPSQRQDATLVELEEEEEEEEGDGADGVGEEEALLPQRCHWSRYFLVDLLALAAPVVPTVAWLCQGAQREVRPMYHIGSLLRGCCAVALHSLRRRAAEARGRGRPTNMNGSTPI